jgi:hypothetical protein
MARRPRIHYPGAFYHVMLRGNDIKRFETILSQAGLSCLVNKLHHDVQHSLK